MEGEKSRSHLISLVNEMIDKHEYKSALFWADKLVSLCNEDPILVQLKADCFFHLKEYHTAIHCLKRSNLHLTSLQAKHLIAKCHLLAKEYTDAFEVIANVDTNTTTSTQLVTNKEQDEPTEEAKWKSSISLVKGQILEALEKPSIAADAFRQALQWNIRNYEAFLLLVSHEMLNSVERQELLELVSHADPLTRYLYECTLKKKYDSADPCPVSKTVQEKLSSNPDVMTAKAENLFYSCEFYACIRLTQEVLEKDLYHRECLPIHISCLFELKKTNQLFDLAHKLVDLYPESAISWFAVGCYYLMVNKTDCARRYLSKATTLDPVFGPAWLLFGHSFAVDSEHDQAMAAYFKSSHLMKGSHLPLLYVGLEHALTDNVGLAEKFFRQAHSLAPNDPFVLHELGVNCFQNKQWKGAESYFTSALSLIKSKADLKKLPDKWEPIVNNLGHVMRKQHRYSEALEYHKQALSLCPQNSSTYSAIGFVHALSGDWEKAVESFHKSLAIRRDDPFTKNLMTEALDNLIKRMNPSTSVTIRNTDATMNEEVSKAESSPGSFVIQTNIAIKRNKFTHPTLSDSEMDTTI